MLSKDGQDVTDCADVESSRSSFFDDGNCNSNDDDDWNAMEAIFTQHDQSLSQNNIGGEHDGSGEEDSSDCERERDAPKQQPLDGEEESAKKPSSSSPLGQKISEEEDYVTRDISASIAGSSQYDDELMNMKLPAPTPKTTPKKQPSRPLAENYGNFAVRSINEDLCWRHKSHINVNGIHCQL